MSNDNRTPYEQDMERRAIELRYEAAAMDARPSFRLRPELRLREEDDPVWVASYGHLEVTGASPDEAFAKFDKAWTESVNG